ncbi:hypothetical protein DOTSEDRAFT_84234 [Dothistroma septosporum NZE10]|uniref:separase n=1 Tax=Dothistroma septosporum (strain NZE10 / CBS 128990) TaxID=675120 RepID=N1PZ16_DOTSN|nr:hypothetical protein DOTSEDRAFT_84234 [Dothistroma septosporum NZE10]
MIDFVLETVKAALATGSASPSTVTTLQSLLCEVHAILSRPTLAKTGPASTAAARRGTAKRTAARPARATPLASGRQAPEVLVLEDVPLAAALSPKARYALATEIVNITLKVLTDATRAGPQQHRKRSPVNNSATPTRTSTPSQSALQLRSANATPVPPPAGKNPRMQRGSSRSSVATASTGPGHLECVAECARLAFSCLSTTDAKELGLRELPSWQLESGMLALCGKLLSLGLRTLAAKQLRAVKHILEAAASPTPHCRPGTGASSKPAQDATISTLLRLHQDVHAKPTILPILISYQLHVMQLLVLTTNGPAVEKAVDHLTSAAPDTPSGTILRHVESGADPHKAAKNLETLSRTILQLCPSISAAADEQSRDLARYPTPLSVFRLQVASLSLQQQSQRLINRAQDIEKDIIEQFSKCLSTLLRRTGSRSEAGDLLETCTASYRALGLQDRDTAEGNSAGLNILMTLSRVSQLAGSHEQAMMYAEMALKQCHNLERSHARCVAALTRRVCSTLSSPGAVGDRTSARQDLETVTESLQRNLSGHASDYEMLLMELSQMGRISPQVDKLSEEQIQLLRAAAAFASRYVRVCSGKHSEIAQEIVHLALSVCGSSEDSISWVTSDTASVMIKSGALRRLADKAAFSSLALVCCSSGTAIAFGRVVKFLITKAITSGPVKSASYIVDTVDLDPSERGLLLEWQLKCALDLIHKPKYRQSVSKLVQELARRLGQVYDGTAFPIRQARISALVLRVREAYPEVLPPHAAAVFGKASLDHISGLGKDEGLRSYLPDLRATLNLSRAFCDGRPSLQQLDVNLDIWESLLERSQTPADIDASIDSPAVFAGQLRSLEEYLGMIGDDVSRLSVGGLLAKFTKLHGTATEQCSSTINVARSLMALGCAENARDMLRVALHLIEDNENTPSLEMIDCHLAKAECMLLLDQVAECREALTAAHQARHDLPPQAIKSAQSQRYKMIHGRAWLIQSSFLMASGSSQDALRAAKHASKVMSSIWAGLERHDPSTIASIGKDGSETSDPSVDTLTTKVSKLNLKPAAPGPNSKKNELRGAAFWPVVRLSCQSSLHLADMYAHHGIYNEANYASEQALKTAEAVGSYGLLADIRARRSSFLAVAGRFEESELCLEQEDFLGDTLPSLSSVERLKVKAAACAERGDPNAAVVHLKEAGENLKLLMSYPIMTIKFEKEPSKVSGLPAAKSALSGLGKPVARAKTATAARATIRQAAISREAPRKPTARSTAVTKPAKNAEAATVNRYVLRRIQAELAFCETAIEVKYGSKTAVDIHELETIYVGLCHGIQWRLLEQEVLLSKTMESLESDFSLSVLNESVLSHPSLQRCHSLEGSTTLPTAQTPAKSSRSVASLKKSVTTARPAADLRPALTDCHAERESNGVVSTIEAHQRHDLLSATCMITSATSTISSLNHHDLTTQSLFSIEQGRVHASQSVTAVACVERGTHDTPDPLAWPGEQVSSTSRSLTFDRFQSEYIDILPRTWTAVSINLSESCEELYVAKYRGAQSPLVLRIPFSRQKSDEAEQELFLFEDGKSELEEIINLSNFSCHNNLDTSAKGAKTNWWAEREALDRRLHELLINMENLWLGGFRGILSQHGQNLERLDRFRQAFEAILDRHLPSRRVYKRGTKKLVLDDQILELFIGLVSDQDGELELDDLLAELLYFVVDILQFNGERNAYDEVDIDRMVVDVLDSMRNHCDALHEKDDESHLILVLDRRLQAFPWESLPCLEKVSVSRMDSMQSLRERIITMRQQVQTAKDTQHNRYAVSRSSGTYILNPGGDLKSTESTLAPELAQIINTEGAGWKSIVRRAPNEDEFKSALTSASTLLYFGHGAGSQYIRPRAIRRLDRCSEVVWLMGCSSGAVTEYGKLEASAVPLTYMLAGQARQSRDNSSTQPSGQCMSVLATLWDVTDKDIDRFSLAVGEEWGLWKAPEVSTKLPAKTPRKKEKVVAPCTPEEICKTPRTPKAKKTPVAPKTPVRSGSVSQERGQQKRSLVEAVARSRDACYLRYLNGAAPVVYGIPVWLGD